MNSRDKDNFAQAMKELLNSGEGAAPAEDKKAGSPSSLSFGETPAPAATPTPAPAAGRVATTEGEEKPGKPVVPMFSAESRAPSDEVTIIAPGTKIVGDIETDGGLQVGGSIKGNLRVASKLDLNGRIIGDVEAQDISITTSVVKGNVTAHNMLAVDKDTTVVGDVVARNAEINGKVKGNVTVSERAHIRSDSILVGNLASGTVNVEEGAMLKGDISITNVQKENLNVEDLDFDIKID